MRPAAASPELNETLSRLQGEVLSLGLEVAIAERPATLGATASRVARLGGTDGRRTRDRRGHRRHRRRGRRRPSTSGSSNGGRADPRVSRVALEPDAEQRAGAAGHPRHRGAAIAAWSRSIWRRRDSARRSVARQPPATVAQSPPQTSAEFDGRTSTCRPAPPCSRAWTASGPRSCRSCASAGARARGSSCKARWPDSGAAPRSRRRSAARASRQEYAVRRRLHLRRAPARVLAALRRALGRRAAHGDRR